MGPYARAARALVTCNMGVFGSVCEPYVDVCRYMHAAYSTRGSSARRFFEYGACVFALRACVS